MEPLSYVALIFNIKCAYLLCVLLFYMCIHTFQVFNANPLKYFCVLHPRSIYMYCGSSLDPAGELATLSQSL